MNLIIMLLMYTSANAQTGDAGLNTIKNMKVSESSVISVDVMPRVRSQDSVGLCCTFSAATLIDQANCQAANKDGQACAAASDDLRASTLDLARYSEYAGEGMDEELRAVYEGIKEGCKVPVVARNAMLTQRVAKESCAPFVQITSGIENPDAVEGGLWNRFKQIYQKNKRINPDESCPTCEAQAASIKSEFSLKAENKDILASFGQDTYNKFLDKLLIPEECGAKRKALKLLGKWEVGTYPISSSFTAQDDDKSKEQKMIEEIKRVLSGLRRPVAIDYCADVPFNKDQKCELGHAVVIKGYRKVCETENPNKCRNMFQVQNSWGEKWQRDNDQGWVDGDEILRRTHHDLSTISWLKDAPVETAEAQ